MVRNDERERRRRRVGVLSDRVSASRAAVLAPGRPAAGEHPDRVYLRSSDRAGRDARARTRDASLDAPSRWHLEHLPDDPDRRGPVVGAQRADTPVGESRRPNRTVDFDDVRAPSAVTEVDDVGEVGTPDWLPGRPDQDGDEGDVSTGRFGGARVDPGRRGVLTLAVVGLIAVVVTAFVVMRQRPVSFPVPPLASVQTTTVGPGVPSTVAQPAEAGISAGGPPDAPGEIVVSVVGLVHHGGLVRLPAGARVADAVAAAGGARDGADLTGINLAQRVRDGDQILVGAARQDGSPQLGSTTSSGSGTVQSSAVTTSETGPTGKVDLNFATEAQLDALPGVGPVTARAIMNWRNANGRFTSVDQLAEVDGIGPARLARLRDLVTV